MPEPVDVPLEFQIPNGEAQPLDAETARWHLEELLLLREHASEAMRNQYRIQTEAEAAAEASRRAYRELLQAFVEVVDELRRSHVEAAAHMIAPPATERQGWFGKKRDAPPARADDAATEWLAVFGRLWRMAENRLRQSDVHRVELIGQNLKAIQFAGQSVQRWIAVKGGANDQTIQQEHKGLWVERDGQHVTLVQRGEVGGDK